MTIKRIRWIFWTLTFLQWFPVGFMLPVFVLTMDERGVTLGQIGLVFATYGITTALLELPTGGLADAIGRKPVLMMASLLNVAMMVVWLSGDTFPIFMAGAFIGGVGRALSTGPLVAWYVDSVHDLDPDNPIRAGLAGAGAADALGIAISSLAVAGLSFIPDLPADGPIVSTLRLPPLLAALSATLHLAAIWLLIEERRDHLTSIKEVTKTVPKTVSHVIGLGLRSGPMRLVFAAMLLIGVGLASVELLYQPFFSDMIGSTTNATRLFGFLAFGFALAAGGGSALAALVPEDRVHPAPVTSVSLMIAALIVVGFGQTGSVGPAVGLFLATYVVVGFAGPFIDQLLHAGATSAERSTMVSAGSLSTQGGVLVTGILIAQIAANYSIPTALAAAGGAIVTASILMIRIYTRHGELASPRGRAADEGAAEVEIAD